MSLNLLHWGRLSTRWQLAIAVTVAIVGTMAHFVKREVVNPDGVRLVHCAQEILNGNWSQGLEHEGMFFVPCLIACIHQIIPDWTLAGQIISMAAMALVIVPFYLLAKDLFGKDRAFLASLFFATIPYFRETSVLVLRDPVFLLAVAWSLLAFFRIATAPLRYHAIAGMSTLVAALSRREGVFLLCLYLAIALWQGIHKAGAIRRLLWGIGAALVIATAIIICRRDSGKTNRMEVFFSVAASPGRFYKELKVHELSRVLGDMEKQRKSAGQTTVLLETVRHYLPAIYLLVVVDSWIEGAFPVVFILGIAGIWAEASFRSGKSRALLLWLGFFTVFPYLFLIYTDIISRRYLLASVMVLSYWSGSGFEYLWQKTRDKLALSPGWAVLFLALLLLAPCAKMLRSPSSKDANIRKAGEWLKEQHAQSAVSNERRILFYAQISFYGHRTDVVDGQADLSALMEKAKNRGAQFVAWVGEKEKAPPAAAVFPGKKTSIFIYRVENSGEGNR